MTNNEIKKCIVCKKGNAVYFWNKQEANCKKQDCYTALYNKYSLYDFNFDQETILRPDWN